jgi:hypothetical protein
MFENKLIPFKTGFCFINGSCTAEKEMAPVGCLACQSIKDKYNWTGTFFIVVMVKCCYILGTCLDCEQFH